ncbi:sensitivity to high expression protein she9 [Elasticomyces elasticus]|nr:sensitivity to high expression protein she9 [Elasticomyces elasticus]
MFAPPPPRALTVEQIAAAKARLAERNALSPKPSSLPSRSTSLNSSIGSRDSGGGSKTKKRGLFSKDRKSARQVPINSTVEARSTALPASPLPPPPPPPPPPPNTSPTSSDLNPDTLPLRPPPRPGLDPPASHPTNENQANAEKAEYPSQMEKQRWLMSKRMSIFMDDMLAKATIASQHLNVYTGTDYSRIEQLRREITDQEKLVKACHAKVAVAKEAYTATHTTQTAAQKEVVALLERKHSWSATDLERYMSLIRSEHLNEVAVQAAKDALAEAERDLEDVRTNLEKKERKQYHEEQIWSDTIRRNSTWVTFGLMGLNIFLLLASLVIIEPWRRRRLVREVRRALEEKSDKTGALPLTAAEAAIDKVVESAEIPIEAPEHTDASDTGVVVVDTAMPVADEPATEQEPVGELALEVGEVLPPETTDIAEAVAAPAEPEAEAPATVPAPVDSIQIEPERLSPESWTAMLEVYKEAFQDLFSERQIQLKKVDITTIALEGAAAGVAVMGLLFVLLRPR